MKDSEMDEVIESRLQKIKEILLVKAKEYVRNGDRLHNFNTAAKMAGTTRERALQGFMIKHFVSVFDIINDIDNDNKLPSIELLEEKIGDSINYLILLEASIKNKIQKRGMNG